MTEDDGGPVLPGIDTSTPNTARVYDYLLGGTNSFPADRAMAQELLRLVPDTRERIRENREFMGRAVRDLVTAQGITQFLDIGSGLPANDNVHQIVQRISADSSVVYVDHDHSKSGCAHAYFARLPSQSAKVQTASPSDGLILFRCKVPGWSLPEGCPFPPKSRSSRGGR